MLWWGGTRVDGYRLHVLKDPLPHPYPWNDIIVMSMVLTVEAMVFYAVIRPESYRRSWGRALAAAILGLLLWVFIGLSLMHGPPYEFAHQLWLALATVSFVALAAVRPLPL